MMITIFSSSVLLDTTFSQLVFLWLLRVLVVLRLNANLYTAPSERLLLGAVYKLAYLLTYVNLFVYNNNNNNNYVMSI